MKTEAAADFGQIIAFLIPGFVGLWGATYVSPEIRTWLVTTSGQSKDLANVVFVLLASLAIGLTVSAARAIFLDWIHEKTGVRMSKIDYKKLNDANAKTFDGIIQNHYRYYQYYGNTLVAVVVAVVIRQIVLKELPWADWGRFSLGLLVLVALYFGSRDSLDRCRRKMIDLLGEKTT